MSDTAWLFVAFAAVWIALGAYLLSLATRQKRLERRLAELDPATDRVHEGPAQTHNL